MVFYMPGCFEDDEAARAAMAARELAEAGRWGEGQVGDERGDCFGECAAAIPAVPSSTTSSSSTSSISSRSTSSNNSSKKIRPFGGESRLYIAREDGSFLHNRPGKGKYSGSSIYSRQHETSMSKFKTNSTGDFDRGPKAICVICGNGCNLPNGEQ